jgi:hypothetical protein
VIERNLTSTEALKRSNRGIRICDLSDVRARSAVVGPLFALEADGKHASSWRRLVAEVACSAAISLTSWALATILPELLVSMDHFFCTTMVYSLNRPTPSAPVFNVHCRSRVGPDLATNITLVRGFV